MNKEKRRDWQDEEMTKYAVECKCAEGKPPAKEFMEKLADAYKCLACGRLHPADDRE